MKILHITPAYKPAFSKGGPIWSVHSLNKSLSQKGVDVTVYTTDIGSEGKVPLSRSVDLDGVKVFYFPASFPKKWEHSEKLRKSLSKSIDKFDVVHITSVFLSSSFVGSYYSRKHNVPYIISPRGSLMKGTLNKRNSLLKKLYLKLIERNNLKRSSRIHFTTVNEMEEYKSLGLPISKPVIIPNGLESSEIDISSVSKGKFRKKYNIPEDKKIILFLSRINWKKGLDTLIPSFKDILKEYSNSILVIAGGDDKDNYLHEVKKMVDSYNLNDKVLFTGMVLGKDKISIYKDADLFILPSYSENFGIVIAEAMYFGLPVITTPHVGISNIVEESESGFVVKKDKQKISDAAIKLLKDKKLSKKMSKNGKRTAQKEFSINSVSDKWIDEYNDIIS